MTRQNRRGEIKKVQAYVRNAEAEINKLAISPRIAYRYPFDIVGLATLAKVFALSNACLTLVSSDLSDEAFGLARSIVECATNLRYLTADSTLQNQRARDFVQYALADKAFWAHYALEQFAGRKEEREIRDYAMQQGIVPDTRPARRHWSGKPGFIWDVTNIDHPLDGPTTPRHKKISYAADYFQTSAFVRCSLSAIDNYYIEEKVPFRVASSTELHETSQSTLFIVLIYLHSSIGYVLHGMNLDRPDKLNSFFQRTLKTMQAVRTR
jgi:hypothetical protein